MSNGNQIPQQQTSSTKMLRAMVGIGLLCALLIVLTYEGTFARIERNKAAALDMAVFNVVQGIDNKIPFELTGTTLTAIGEDGATGSVIYAGYDSLGTLKGFAIEGSGMGYADIIRILYGYDHVNETVTGITVLESKETPGLGDKIEKDEAFLANFEALDVKLNASGDALANMVVPVKNGEKTNAWEVDGITGATISSRAIANIIGESSNIVLPVIRKNLDALESNKE